MKIRIFLLLLLQGVFVTLAISERRSGVLPSFASLMRGQTGITSPESARMPPWARRNLADASFVSQNSALLPYASEYKMALHPAVVRTRTVGGASPAVFTDLLTVSDYVDAAGDGMTETQTDFGMRGVVRDVGFSLNYSRVYRGRSVTENLGAVQVDYYQDFTAQLAVGGTLFEREDIGRFELGTGLKAIFRKGDQRVFSSSDVQSGAVISTAEFTKLAFAGGLDYGLHYTAPRLGNSDWIIQTALVWNDVGTTPFFVGSKTSMNRRFDPYHNNIVWGVGLGVPKFLDKVSSSLRLEYFMGPRVPAWADRLAWGFEMRWPVLISARVGMRGSSLGGGASLRYGFLEIEAGTFVELYAPPGSSRDIRARTTAVELRALL